MFCKMKQSFKEAEEGKLYGRMVGGGERESEGGGEKMSSLSSTGEKVSSLEKRTSKVVSLIKKEKRGGREKS